MPKAVPTLEDLTKINPNIDAKQIAELDELTKKLSKIPRGQQRLPSPIMRRRIIIGETSQSDPRTIRLSTHR